MVSSLEQVREQFQVLRQTYAQNLLSKIQEIETVWEQMRTTKQTDERLWETLQCLTHRLVGSGATFGFSDLSDAAKSLESGIQPLLDREHPLSAATQNQITMLVAALKQAAITVNLNQINQKTQPADCFPEHCISRHENKLVLLIEDDPYLAEDLAIQISYFGYQVKTIQQLAGLKEVILETVPAAIIMDIMFPEGRLAGAEIMSEIQQLRQTPIPVMFISARHDMAARLQAVRAGGVAYFTKPVDISSLIDKLDTLTAVQEPEPFRVLIVEDDVILAEYHALILKQAGMNTTVVTDPMQIIQPLTEVKPDLILMDVYMPECSGLELAAVIRQQDAYVSIPIVFLSVERAIDKHLAAMHLGGDQFLTKPIEPDHLVSEITSRVQRSRILRSYMIRDSLTGLLNHTNTKQQIYIEVARAKREKTPLSFAMIDIDYFKSVNDIYGHLTGDRVIRSLARLLQQRLRKTDIIGRYGGEEFAVILPNTDGTCALKVINEIREGFAQVRQQSDIDEFSVTFSAGIATFPYYKDAAYLSDAADKALYQSKREGRNRVVLMQKE